MYVTFVQTSHFVVLKTVRAFGATCSGGGNTARFEGPTAFSEGHTGTYGTFPRTHGDLRQSLEGSTALFVELLLHFLYIWATLGLHFGNI